MMMPPPTLVHQRIVAQPRDTAQRSADGRNPAWQADREVGIWLKGDKKYNPEPDVTVIDAAIALGQIYVTRFYFVAEVLSDSDKKAVLDAKLAYYKEHEHNRCILFVHQDAVGADLHIRQGSGRLAPQATVRLQCGPDIP